MWGFSILDFEFWSFVGGWQDGRANEAVVGGGGDVISLKLTSFVVLYFSMKLVLH